jgi:hypothetical protein
VPFCAYLRAQNQWVTGPPKDTNSEMLVPWTACMGCSHWNSKRETGGQSPSLFLDYKVVGEPVPEKSSYRNVAFGRFPPPSELLPDPWSEQGREAGMRHFSGAIIATNMLFTNLS